jgi:uncharacterized delta-60 repeat protein
MKLYKYLPIVLLVIACAVMSIACSNGKSPVEPSSDDLSGISSDLPISFGTDIENRNLLAIYDAVIDPVSKTFTITPDNRSAQYHYPLTQMYPSVLKITGYGFTPNLWADIKLVHPYPGSSIKGYDPRVIAILPANAGVRFIYPTLGVGGNNAVVLEPDGYTKLFDSLGGSILGNVNPFKAYFKDQPYRVWSGTGVTEETQRWQMNIAGFGGPLQFKLVVDVSTNYPNPPQPIIDNAQEPVQINAKVCQGLTSGGGTANISVNLLDWQGKTSIGGIKIEAPELFNGTISLAYSAPGPNPNEYVYTGKITNTLLAPEGEYKLLVATWDHATGIIMYREFAVIVRDDGNLIWVNQAGGDEAFGNGITSLSDNSTVVTGYFWGTATFGLGEPNETVLTTSGGYDIFIARYNLNGTLSWAKCTAGTGYGSGWAITSLSDDSIVVTGQFSGSVTFGSGEINETVLLGSNDIFIARYNPDGTLVWVKSAGGPYIDSGFAIITLSDNSTVVTGYFDYVATFGPGESNQTVLTSAGYTDVFIARYNSNGTLAWAKRSGGVHADRGNGITSLSDNSTVVTGAPFIARYDLNGTLVWTKEIGGSGQGITTLSDNSTVVTGYIGFEGIFGAGEINETILTSAGGYDIFIAQYNPNGTLAWAKRAGGTIDEKSKGITALSDNSTVVTGWFGSNNGGSSTFGADEPNETVLISTGEYDIFIARYNPDGTLAWAKRAGGSGENKGWGITTLSDDSTVATGWFFGHATFGPGEPNETVLSGSGMSAIFIARFEP